MWYKKLSFFLRDPISPVEKKEIESEFQRSSREHREYLEKSGIVPVEESCILVERDNYVEEVTFQQYQKEKEQEANALQQSNIECVCDNNYNTYCHSVGPIKEILVTDNIEAARTTADLQKFEDLQRKKPLVITYDLCMAKFDVLSSIRLCHFYLDSSLT